MDDLTRTVQERQLLALLISRIERISVDSVWAHRASGVRGTLLKMIVEMENGQVISPVNLRRAIDAGFEILEASAREQT